MWLINVHTGKLEKHMVAPPYAILSHTWRDSEISFQDRTTYADIDTCCIDKSSSPELSEAINSMFRWYRDSAVCFAYLEDLPIGQGAATKLELERCRWFTRGWTLQELIVPTAVRFYDRGWNDRGTKAALRGAVSRITGVRLGVLLGEDLSRLGSIPVAVRMSWASRRTTTLPEDMALIYGEGANAFIRLQEEIIKRINDLSILAWDSRERCRIGPYCGILAASPADFAHASRNFATTS
ncbi:hypothetical protein B0T26DRAFT_741525 [Lasiosphaeria miniovina]|uniref:DUF8212 domain-containing protein n=1 Tax=Lasiosphaeria miniovina TaxID=1954250 RepID=A0AA40AMR7_9PEZI|nr:uncharacterized protein B0T26DRAFT_741525 [Lasiosphaeria miniovina]KAK0718674.1 hypothetical protein B0T26DRAFT_741525 [Lasiosphaeria miniovina]